MAEEINKILFWVCVIISGITIISIVSVPILFSMNWMMFIVLAIITVCMAPILTVSVFGEKGFAVMAMFFLVLSGLLLSAAISANSPRFWKRHVEFHDPFKKEKKPICNYQLRDFVDQFNKGTSGANRINCD